MVTFGLAKTHVWVKFNTQVKTPQQIVKLVSKGKKE
jgi:hypothetical protein